MPKEPKAARWESEPGTTLPPERDLGGQVWRMKIGFPSVKLTQNQTELWAQHLREKARELDRFKEQLLKRENKMRDEEWKTENEIKGLRATVEWQAKVIGETAPHLRMAVEPVTDLIQYIPEFTPDIVKKDMKRDGNEGYGRHCSMPFFSEAFLYPLLGKEEARSLLARIHKVAEGLGLDLEAELNKAVEPLKREKEEYEGRQARIAAHGALPA